MSYPYNCSLVFRPVDDIPESIFGEKWPPLNEKDDDALWSLVLKNRSAATRSHPIRAVGEGAVVGSEIVIGTIPTE
jgi:hypothetical protein